jgi:hypothetical protein
MLFSLLHSVQAAVGHTQPPIEQLPDTFSPGGKAAGVCNGPISSN